MKTPRWTVYCHIHIATGRRYIGQTKLTPLSRWNGHVRSAFQNKKGCSHFWAAIRKYGKEAFSLQTLEVCDSIEEANEAEEAWIESFSSRFPEFGFNLMKGGRRTTQYIRKNPWDDPEYRVRCTTATQAQWKDPANLAQNAASARARWSDPNYRKRVTSAAKEALSKPEVKLRHSEGLKAAYASPEARKRLSEIAKRTSSRPDVLAKLRANWDDPVFREKCSTALHERNAREASKTHCKNGHLYTDETTYVSKRGGRECSTCKNDRNRAKRTHCPSGHEYTSENTRHMKSGGRICVVCRGASLAILLW